MVSTCLALVHGRANGADLGHQVRWWLRCAVASLGLIAGGAEAQASDAVPANVATPPVRAGEIVVPVFELPEQLDQASGGDDELDVANIVQSATKGLTTVQEAPAIVTVVTSAEIAQKQPQTLGQITDYVPGWYRANLLHSTFDLPLVRGQSQAVLFLTDALSLFDPYVNVPTTSRLVPVELIKRVEMVTGPGGVLWGANSLLGVLNVITKDAADIDGVTAGTRLGHGPGDPWSLHSYVMAGKPNAWRGLSVFAHASLDTYDGPSLRMPVLLFHQPLPQPNSPNQYGPLAISDAPRSWVGQALVKLGWGAWQLRLAAPMGHKYLPLGLSGTPVREQLAGDATCVDGTFSLTCVDPQKTSRHYGADYYDRYAVAEYRRRWAKLGLTAKAYGIQFVRRFAPLQILAASPSVPGGLQFSVENTSYRAGSTVDVEATLPHKLRVLAGLEGFHEWKPDDTRGSLQGPGSEATFGSPHDVSSLPLLCPRSVQADGQLGYRPGCPVTFAFPASRSVFGGYVSPVWQLSPDLTVSGGARLQLAPAALGSLAYPLNTTLGAAAVWRFMPGWHVKANYAQGFRPPVFNNTASNGAAVQIAGDPTLDVETADALQGEVNARVFRGARALRELEFRADISWTRLRQLIQVTSGRYHNAGERQLISGELLARLFVRGGQRLELAYTYLQVRSADKGRLRTLPEHWLSLGMVRQLLRQRLSVGGWLRVSGATEDANRLVEHRDASFSDAGTVAMPVTVSPTDLVMDRLGPRADLSLSLAYTPLERLVVTLAVDNALASRAYHPDAFADYEPHLEYLPNPIEGLRAYIGVRYTYE